MKETIFNAVRKAGNIYLANVTLTGKTSNSNQTAFKAEIAEFAILFAMASRSYHNEKKLGMAGQLVYFFKNEKYFDLIEGKEKDAEGNLEWIEFREGDEHVYLEIAKKGEVFKLRFKRVNE